MTPGGQEPDLFDISDFARRVSSSLPVGDIIFTAPLPPQPPGTLVYPQYACAVGTTTGNTVTVIVAVPPSDAEAQAWLARWGRDASEIHGTRVDHGPDMTQWEITLEADGRRVREYGLSYRAGRYVVALRIGPASDASPLIDVDHLKVAALASLALLEEA